jgi:predicted metal-dependent phosphotriesterase family hydrolase
VKWLDLHNLLGVVTLTERILLSTDWMFGLTILPTGTLEALRKSNPDGNLFNIRKTIPYLRELGVTEAQIRTITVNDPKAFFARAG